MPLSMLSPGQEGVIRAVSGREEVRTHLARLGFVADAVVRVVSSLGGSLILQVKDSRVALDKALASHIVVM